VPGLINKVSELFPLHFFVHRFIAGDPRMAQSSGSIIHQCHVRSGCFAHGSFCYSSDLMAALVADHEDLFARYVESESNSDYEDDYD
jgi:hypothetical protein